MELKILGEPASKANARRLVQIHGRMVSIKSAKALDYEKYALLQLATQLKKHKPFDKPVGVEITIYYASQRPDLDASLIFDIMQKAGVYVNDRLVREQHLFHAIDKLNPRSDILIWPLQED